MAEKIEYKSKAEAKVEAPVAVERHLIKSEKCEENVIMNQEKTVKLRVSFNFLYGKQDIQEYMFAGHMLACFTCTDRINSGITKACIQALGKDSHEYFLKAVEIVTQTKAIFFLQSATQNWGAMDKTQFSQMPLLNVTQEWIAEGKCCIYGCTASYDLMMPERYKNRFIDAVDFAHIDLPGVDYIEVEQLMAC